jgi:hypothetical protein
VSRFLLGVLHKVHQRVCSCLQTGQLHLENRFPVVCSPKRKHESLHHHRSLCSVQSVHKLDTSTSKMNAAVYGESRYWTLARHIQSQVVAYQNEREFRSMLCCRSKPDQMTPINTVCYMH